MGRYTGKTCRLLSMLVLTASFFVVEITVGYISNSIALVADSFHMLSDVVALVVGYASVRVSKWKTKKNTFGWQRAEVLGALVNTVFLVALCFTIVVDSLQRFIEIEKVERPVLLLVVGVLGLLVNVIGLFLFHSHGHSHGGHSHGGQDGLEDELLDEPLGMQVAVDNSGCNGESVVLQVDSLLNRPGPLDPGDHGVIRPGSGTDDHHGHSHGGGSQLNMKGVFLHVLGDALGSVVVIISALIIWFVEGEWKYYIDPALSMFMVLIMLGSAIPLLKETSLILLQTVPTHIQVREMQGRLIQKIEGVLAVHEFHVWRLTGDRIIASAHIKCRNLSEYMRIAEEVKEFFHKEGIHSTTIQPEFAELNAEKEGRQCSLECGPDKTCYTNTCCATKKPPVRREKSPSRSPKGHQNRLSTISKESVDQDALVNKNQPEETSHNEREEVSRTPATPALPPAAVVTVSAPNSPVKDCAPVPAGGPQYSPPVRSRSTKSNRNGTGHETSV